MKGVDLEVGYGEVYSRRQWRRKTTTIKMLCGLIEPSEETSLAGERVGCARRRAQQLVGACRRFSPTTI